MTLKGAKFICLDEAGNHGEVVLAKGRKFTIGYYVSCDYVLVDERSKGVHCEIECDAFGRVTIRNLSPDKPISVNGSAVEIKRILLNNSKLSILDKDYLWLFTKSSSNEFEDLNVQDSSTPQKLIGIPEQPPNSCPDFKLHRELPKRFTVHNFAYYIQSDEEGNTSSESNDDNDSENTESSKVPIDKETTQPKETDYKNETSESADSDREKEKRNRSITPEPNTEIVKSTIGTELMETPKMNLINCTKNKENNNSTEKKNKQLLKMCHQSDVVITSFSPRETGVKICKSFATVIKPKVLVTKPPTTPKSVYSTPTSAMNEKNQDDVNDIDFIVFHTPSTSKKGIESATGLPTTTTKVLKNSSMHLIDLTSPFKQRPASPYLKSALKASAKKNNPFAVDKSCTKLSSTEQLGLTALPATPVATNASINPVETPPSVISVNSSTDNSSVIEVTSDGSHMGTTLSTATGFNTPLRGQTRVGTSTPKKTPQSLMKRAILTSAKKQNITPQKNIQNPITPRREAINRIPLRSNLAVRKTPITPRALTGNSSISQLPRRQSMSTPSRKSTTQKHFDNTPSTSKISASPSIAAKTFARRSTLNPFSATKALPTSTPVSGNSAFRNRATCKTSPLHKVRKSLGGIPLSSHISKSRKSIFLAASNSKITSIKDKSPQQVLSDRLVNRARKSIIVTPISARTRNMVEAAKTPSQSNCPSSMLKDKSKLHLTKRPECKAVLFDEKSTEDDIEVENLSRTFILDSNEHKENVNMKKNATFTPEKDTTKKGDITETNNETQAIEIPVDAEEVVDLCNENKENKNQTNNEEPNCSYPCHEVKHSIAIEKENSLKDEAPDKTKSVVTEESFAEEITVSMKQNIMSTSSHASTQVMSSQTESQATSAESTKNDGTEELSHHTSIKNDNDNTNVVDTGFGEESTIENSKTSSSKITVNTESENKTDTGTKIIRSDTLEKTTKSEFEKISATKAEDEAKFLDEKTFEESLKETKNTTQNSNEYKPIVEDITLESSSIEKETKDNQEINTSKQPLYAEINLESSPIDEKVKSEEIKEENTETTIEESDDKELQVSAVSSKGNQMSAQLVNTKHTNIEVANIILTTDEISNRIEEEKEEILVDDSRNLEKPITNSNILKCSDINQCANIVEVKSDATKTPQQNNDIQSEMFNVSEAEENETDLKSQEIYQSEQSAEVHINEKDAEDVAKSASQNINIVHEIDKNLDDTNKLLEEIEDVLNKSDEIKQKQLNEIEKTNDKPLTEEFESDKFSQESLKLTETETLLQNSEGAKYSLNEFSDSDTTGLSKPENENDNNCNKQPEKQILADITAEIPKSPAVEKCEPATENAIIDTNAESIAFETKTTELLPTSEQESKIQNKNVVENVSKVSESNVENILEENCTQIVKIIDVQNQINKSFESEQTVRKSDESLNIGQSLSILNVESTENEMSINNPKQLKLINKNVENVANSTPRRSSRRSSQSTDTPEATAELTFTPRRSARRSSMSAVSAATVLTPAKRTTRRASSSVVNDTPLTPKSITKRRLSASVEDQTCSPSTSKLAQRAKTPRKQLALSMIIPEEKDEVCHVIMEGEEVSELERIGIEENKTTSQEKGNEILTKPLKEIELVNKQNVKSRDGATCSIETILDRESCDKDLEENTNQTAQLASTVVKDEKETGNADVEGTLDSVDDINTKENMLNEKESPVIVSSENDVFEENADELITSTQDDDKYNIEVKDAAAVLKGQSEAIEEKLECQIEQEHFPENEAKLLQDEESSADYTEIDQEHTQELISEQQETTKNQGIDKDSSEYHQSKEMADSSKASSNIEKSVNENVVVDKSHRTLEAEVGTPLLGDIIDLLRSPQVTEGKKVELGKLTESIDSVNDPKGKTPKTTKRVTIVADSPRTPLMTGVRELLKTPKPEMQTPRLAGIRNLVLTPKNTEMSETEEIEQLGALSNLVKSPETSTPKTKKHVTIAAKSPKTPLMTGIRELLKTPKPETQTPRLAGIRNLVLTPKNTEEIESEEMEKLALLSDLVKTPETLTPKCKKRFTIAAESPKTPSMTGMRELLKTPKAELSTPKFTGIRDLVKSPKSCSENAQEEIEKLAMVAELVRTPECTTNKEEMPSSSIKHVKQLHTTPKKVSTPHLKTPNITETPITTGVQEIVESPILQTSEDAQDPNVELEEENLHSTTSQNAISLKGVKELLTTPKSCSTPLLKGLRELMKTPKMSSTPILSGIKELMDDSTVQQKDQGLEKYLKTPTAKNIMIPSMPSSAVIEKSCDSIEISTEYDLNATSEVETTTNLGDLFKTPVASRFVERITASYYGEDETEEVDNLNKTAEEAFDKLIGQESQIQTPIHKRYTRKSFTLQTPTCSSPFTAAEVLSDLPKTDVEEWIENLDQAETPKMIENDNEEEEEGELMFKDVNKSCIDSAEAVEINYSLSINNDDQSLNESVVPETCAKVFITEKLLQDKSTTSFTYTGSKDPLLNTEEKPTPPLEPFIDAEISGINLLDQTIESIQDESGLLDEPLFVEEPSMFDEPLVVSDNESESENENTLYNSDISKDDGNYLSEPLLVSDSEDLNQSLELELNDPSIITENKLEVVESKEKSMLEKSPNELDLLAEDPLETEDKEASVVMVEEHNSVSDISQTEADYLVISTANAEVEQSNGTQTKDQTLNEGKSAVSSKEHQKSLINIDLAVKVNEENNALIEIADNIDQNISETEISSTSQIDENKEDPAGNAQINLMRENIVAEMDSAKTPSDQVVCGDNEKTPFENKEAKEVAIEQTNICSTDSADIFVDSSVTEICEETNILNEEQTEANEIPQKMSKEKTNDDCHDVFMDNSNIDEAFADEENNTAFREAITKTSLKEEQKQFETEPTTISEHVEFEYIAETSSVTETEVSSEVNAESQNNPSENIEQEHNEIKTKTTTSVEQESTDNLNETQKIDIPKTEIEQDSTLPCENVNENEEKLKSAAETTSVIEKDDSSEVNVESYLNQSENIEQDHIENNTCAITHINQLSTDNLNETDKVDIPKTAEILGVPLPDENLTGNDEKLYSPEETTTIVIEVKDSSEKNLESEYQTRNVQQENIAIELNATASTQQESTDILNETQELEKEIEQDLTPPDDANVKPETTCVIEKEASSEIFTETQYNESENTEQEHIENETSTTTHMDMEATDNLNENVNLDIPKAEEMQDTAVYDESLTENEEKCKTLKETTTSVTEIKETSEKNFESVSNQSVIIEQEHIKVETSRTAPTAQQSTDIIKEEIKLNTPKTEEIQEKENFSGVFVETSRNVSEKSLLESELVCESQTVANTSTIEHKHTEIEPSCIAPMKQESSDAIKGEVKLNTPKTEEIQEKETSSGVFVETSRNSSLNILSDPSEKSHLESEMICESQTVANTSTLVDEHSEIEKSCTAPMQQESADNIKEEGKLNTPKTKEIQEKENSSGVFVETSSSLNVLSDANEKSHLESEIVCESQTVANTATLVDEHSEIEESCTAPMQQESADNIKEEGKLNTPKTKEIQEKENSSGVFVETSSSLNVLSDANEKSRFESEMVCESETIANTSTIIPEKESVEKICEVEHEDEQHLSLEINDGENTNKTLTEDDQSSKMIVIHDLDSLAEENIINFTPESEGDVVAIENKNDDSIIFTTETSQEKLATILSKEESSNISKALFQTAKKAEEVIEIQSRKDIEEIEDMLLAEKEVLSGENVEINIEPALSLKSMQQSSIVEERTKASSEDRKSLADSMKDFTSSTTTVKYDFEIQVKDRDNLEETEDKLSELATTSSQTKSLQENEAQITETDEIQDYNILKELEQRDKSAVKTTRRKRTVTESSQESIQEEETRKSSRRDRRKIIKKPPEENLEEILEDIKDLPKDTISELVKKDEKSKKKRTISESSQGSVIEIETGGIRTRRGGRRNIQKKADEIVERVKEEVDVNVPKQYEVANPTEAAAKNKENVKESKQAADTEDKKQPDIEFIPTQEETPAIEDLTKEEEQESITAEKTMPKSNINEVAENLLFVSEETAHNLLLEKEDISTTIIGDPAKQDHTKPSDLVVDNLNKVKENETEKQDAIKNEIPEVAAAETVQLSSKRVRRKPVVKNQEGEKVKNQAEDISNKSSPTQSAEKLDEPPSVTMKTTEVPNKRSRSKPAISQSTHVSQQKDESVRPRKNQRKVRKAPIEEDVTVEIQEDEEVLTEEKTLQPKSHDVEQIDSICNQKDGVQGVTLENEEQSQKPTNLITHNMPESIPDLEQEGDKNPVHKENVVENVMSDLSLVKNDVIPLQAKEEETDESPTVSLEVVEPIQKRAALRKPNISKSSQENETSRTRRGGRRIQKPAVEILKEDVINEVHLNIPLEVNKIEEISNDIMEKNATVDTKVSQMSTSESTKTEKTDENLHESMKQKMEQSEKVSINLPGKNEESEEATSGHERKKPAIQEAALDEPTTSRKRRAKDIVSSSEIASAKVESKTKTSHTETEQSVDNPKVINILHQITKESNDEKISENLNISPTKTRKRLKDHPIDDIPPNSGESSKTYISKREQKLRDIDATSPEEPHDIQEDLTKQLQIEKESSPKQTTKRGRRAKVDNTKEKEVNPENTVETNSKSTTRRGGRYNTESKEISASSVVHKSRYGNRNRKTPVEHITGDSQEEQIFSESKTINEISNQLSSTPNEMTLSNVVCETKENENSKDLEVGLQGAELANVGERQKEENSFPKKYVKQNHTPNESNKIAVVDEKPARKRAKHQTQAVDELAEKDIASNSSSPQKTDNKNIPSQHVKEEEEVEKIVAAKTQKSTKRKAAAKPTSKPKINEDIEHDKEDQYHSEDAIEAKNSTESALLSEVKINEINLEPEEPLNKQMCSQEENHEFKIEQVSKKAIAEESHSEERKKPVLSTRSAIAKHVELNPDGISSSIKGRAGRRKQIVEDYKTEEENVPFEEANKTKQKEHPTETNKEKSDTEDTKQTKTSESKSRRRIIGKKRSEDKDQEKPLPEETKKVNEPTNIEEKHNEDDEPDDHNVSSESKHPPEETKKGRVGRRKKNDYKEEESTEPTAAHSPETKTSIQKRKKSITEVGEQEQTTVPIASSAKKDLRVIGHIKAESQGTEDTPGRRARNVPQRRAATAYHNYDETSDSEVTTKIKKKIDSPRKSLDATKKSLTATIASTPIISISPAPSASASITTARGRTRKPTPKVQQYLEQERAKSEIPKKKALLAAAANEGATTPQPEKVTAIETELDATPKASRGRGRGRVAILKDESIILTETITPTVVEEKDVELQATVMAKSTSKVRKGGRKAKITEEESHSTDEPPTKKSPLELEIEKQESVPLLEPPTPTRTAGRRNAAAAAKARIEEDALAAAAIEPPKRARAKKVTQKAAVAQLITSTDTDNYSTTEAEEDQNIKAKNKSSPSKKREHRLNSASTVEGVGDLDDGDIDKIEITSAKKRGRKPATITTTDSPAVPAKRGRKAKLVEESADSKTTRGKGRGRKNADELEVEASSSQQNETDIEPTTLVNPEEVKRGARTRRK